ncbi:uncharacterized protein L3040_009090 [Drepanopeziza brunnea f. sp. 'multigermtubi']|uniref:uncharacterized protein n=1 Tax=Drepanopeziza brunnea f. sp. 'multigermtubi' TaxID=698441 RepID=UPI002385D090|nr:hypothetical protein L3040_009090 [Drepanopeziza brunnea f. sp. 'multigermtubi']
MDHAAMGHGDMGHGGMGHGGMDMGDMCNMNMLFTWDTTNLCLVFRWWHIRSTGGLLISLLAVVGLTAFYEAIRSASRRYENIVARKTGEAPQDVEAVTERTPFLWTGRNQVEVNRQAHVIKALLYALQTFYAFMLMLLFMTYNGWVMAAMAVGSFVGYLVFGNNTSATKDTACH